jgi:hypothetical protein
MGRPADPSVEKHSDRGPLPSTRIPSPPLSQISTRRSTTLDSRTDRPLLLLARLDRPFGVCKVVEVKSPSDKLSEQQRQWLELLLKMGVHAQVCRVAAPAQGGAGSGEDAESDGEHTILPPEQLAASLLRSARTDMPAAASPGRAAPAERIAFAKPKRAASGTPRARKQTRRLGEAPAGRAALADGDREREGERDGEREREGERDEDREREGERDGERVPPPLPTPPALGTDDDFQQPPRRRAPSTAKRRKLKGQSLPTTV